MLHMICTKRAGPLSQWGNWVMLVAALLALLVNCTPAPPPPTVPPPTAHDLNFRLCLNDATGAPSAYGPPTPDGIVIGDMGWTHAVRYVANNGSTSPDVVMQANKDSTNVYLSFEVTGDVTLDKYDAIAIGIDPNGVAGNYRRLHIFPLPAAPGATGSNTPAQSIKYWTGNFAGSAWTWTPAVVPAGIIAKVSWATASPNSSWNVEVVLPITALGLLSTNYFGFWVDVFKTDTDNFAFTESPWPPTARLQKAGVTPTPFTDLETSTPPPTIWGNATIGYAVCNGVYLDTSDITTNHDDGLTISLNQPNTFTANIHNTSLDALGSPKAANGVTALFRIRNYGLPGPPSLWDPIPATSGTNPTGPVTIPAASSATRTIGWNLNATQQAQYNMPTTRSQCILVELNSVSPDTLFINKSAYANMVFKTTNSPFEQDAVIGTEGYERVPGRETLDFLLTEKRYNTPPEMPWRSEIRGLQKIGEGQYKLSTNAKPEVPIHTIVTPPVVKIPSQFLAAKPGAGRNQLKLEARSGDLVTILAQGAIQLRNAKEGPLAHVGANGIDLGEQEAGAKYPLPREKAPWQYVGALIGSWDGFEKDGFVIGSAKSFKVPQNARVLSLAINDTDDGYKQEAGDGFRVQVVETPIEKYFTLNSMVMRDPSVEDIRLPVGVNLPTWILCGRRLTGETVIIEGQKFERAEDVGCFGYILTSIGQQ